MEPNDPTIARAIAVLNALLAEEPEALRELLAVRIPIRAQTVDKIPELVVRDTDPPRLTVLGLINTVMGIAHGDHAYLASVHDEVDGPVRTFGRAFPHCPKCAGEEGAASAPRPSPWGYAATDSPEQWEHANSREEAIQHGRAEWPGEPFYIIEGTRCTTEEFMPSAESIVMEMNDRAQGEAGDPAQDWPDVTNEGGAVLDALLTQWAEKYVTPPRFWLADGKPERIEPEQAPWGYSAEADPDEWLPASSREDAIAKGRERFPGGGFYIATCVSTPSGDVGDADIEEELRRIDRAPVPEFIEPEPATLPTPPEPEEVT